LEIPSPFIHSSGLISGIVNHHTRTADADALVDAVLSLARHYRAEEAVPDD